MVAEFEHMRNHSSGELSKFLDFISYQYMIDNVCLLINGTLNRRQLSELVPKVIQPSKNYSRNYLQFSAILSVSLNKWKL